MASERLERVIRKVLGGGAPPAEVMEDAEPRADKIELPLQNEDGSKLETKNYDWKEWEKSGGVMLEQDWPVGTLLGVESKVKESSKGAVVEFKKLDDVNMPDAGVCYPKFIPVPPIDPNEPAPKKAALPLVTMVILRAAVVEARVPAVEV